MFKIGDKVKILGGYVSGRYDWFREGTEGLIHEIQMHPTMGVVYMVPQSARMYPAERLELVSERYIPSLPSFQLGDKVIVTDDGSICDITDVYLLHNGDAPIIGYGTRHDLTTSDTDEDWYEDEIHKWRGASC